MTFTIFVCGAGRLPGFCGLVHFCLVGGSFRAALGIFALVAAGLDQGPFCSFSQGAWGPAAD